MKSGTGTVFLVLLCLWVWPATAQAQGAAEQSLRSRPIRIIVASGPGGGTDITGRHVARTMGDLMRHTVIVENRPGAGSTTGTDFGAKATPDGHTLLVSSGSSMVMNGFLYRNLPYVAMRDFVAVGFIAAYPFLLMARADLPANTLGELQKYAKERPGKLTFGSAGIGSLQHVWGTILFRSMGLDLLHVPYKGAAMGAQELMGGRIDLMFDNMTAAKRYVESGRAKALVVSPMVRSKEMPNVPTVNESGVVKFDGESWMGMFVPSATPRATVDALRGIFVKVVSDADFIARIEAGGGRVMQIPPQQQQAFLRSENERWGALIKQHGVKAE